MAKDDPARAARMAEALRVNLRLRKAQARAVLMGADQAEVGDGGPAAAPTGAGDAASDPGSRE